MVVRALKYTFSFDNHELSKNDKSGLTSDVLQVVSSKKYYHQIVFTIGAGFTDALFWRESFESIPKIKP